VGRQAFPETCYACTPDADAGGKRTGLQAQPQLRLEHASIMLVTLATRAIPRAYLHIVGKSGVVIGRSPLVSPVGLQASCIMSFTQLWLI
jgi:hypothetical protein